MLTGKFKRDQVPDAKGSRAGYMASMKSQGKTTMSNWDEYCNDESYWKLIGIMEKIGKNHSAYLLLVALDFVMVCYKQYLLTNLLFTISYYKAN